MGVYFGACLLCALALLFLSGSDAMVMRNFNHQGRALRHSLRLTPLKNAAADIDTPVVSFSNLADPEVIEESDVQHMTHVLSLEEQHVGSLSPVLMESPPLDDEPNIRDQHQTLYLNAQAALVVRYSSDDWFFTIRTIGGSKILNRIRKHLLFTTAWAALLTFLYFKKWFVHRLVIPNAGPWNLLIGQSGLSLVFRTNSAYERTWESRTLLQKLGNSCRLLGVLVNSATNKVAHTEPRIVEVRNRFAELVCALPKVLYKHLSYEDDTGKLLGETIHNDEDKATIMGASNRAVRCVQLIGDTVESLPPDLMSAQDKGRVGDEVSTLLGIIGGAEQMVRTPVPKSYSRHTSRSLSLLTWTYPLVLLPDLGWKTVPVIAFVSWLLFAIEEIGHMIENPFDQEIRDAVLNSDTLADLISKDVQDIMSYEPKTTMRNRHSKPKSKSKAEFPPPKKEKRRGNKR